MTQSKHGERFNHDSDADRYDQNVLNEADPIRNGYDELLSWVATKANVQPSDRVVDLGIGSGNLAARLPKAASIIGVDISEEMLKRARIKVPHAELIQTDLLAWAADAPHFDVLISTYAVHHLEPGEKAVLFQRLAKRLKPEGRLVFGDLAFADRTHREEYVRLWQKEGNDGMLEEIEDEFFWDMSEAQEQLSQLGFSVEVERLGALSWGIAAKR